MIACNEGFLWRTLDTLLKNFDELLTVQFLFLNPRKYRFWSTSNILSNLALRNRMQHQISQKLHCLIFCPPILAIKALQSCLERATSSFVALVVWACGGWSVFLLFEFPLFWRWGSGFFYEVDGGGEGFLEVFWIEECRCFGRGGASAIMWRDGLGDICVHYNNYDDQMRS